ncbi:MAG: C-terminal binding protein [Chloroflexi bacterium]|nr:C-terminal binding protein [Chloroflexota bacterium]
MRPEMRFKVVNTFQMPDVYAGERLLEPLGTTYVSGWWLTEEEMLAHAGDADAIICSASHQSFGRRVLGALHRCRIVATFGTGFSLVDLEAATDHGIVVTNVPDYCLDEVSGRAIAFILALGHRLIQLDRAVKGRHVCFLTDRKALTETARPIFRMRDQTVGIIGLGKIGTATAIKARGLGMKVVAYDPYVFDGVMQSWGVEPVSLDTLLRTSDFVSLHAPLTSETRGLFGYEEFRNMKRTAYFINVARGDIVDEAALIRALQEGLIAGAGLDVTAQEPIAPDNPLLEMCNVILTGHSASYSEASDPELWVKPMTQVVMALKGEFPQYAVNPAVRSKWLAKWRKKVEREHVRMPVLAGAR